MQVPLLDLKAQYASIRDEIDAAVAEVFSSQCFIGGPVVEACEQAVAAYSHCDYGIGVSSGTDALLVALMAEGIGPGDEVITTPYTFFATTGSIWRLGAKPILVDIDPLTLNLDPAHVAGAVTERTRAIMPVHLYGRTADMDQILALAGRHDLCVIEDAAQAIGAEYRGRRAGSMGHYGCFSFFPSKNLGGAGDGGMVVTNDPDRADRIRALRNHGMEPTYYHAVVGGNFRLDALQAAVVAVKLNALDGWTEGRRLNAARYDRLFDQAGLSGDPVRLPFDPSRSSPESAEPGCRHIFHQYVVRVPRRDELLRHLKECNVGCAIYYPVPLHLQECFRALGHREGDLPVSEQAARDTLALPIYPELTDDAARYVVECIAAFYA